MRKAIVLVTLLSFNCGAHATSLKDFWGSRAPDDPHFPSTKSSLALEECIGLEISEKVGVPNIIHGVDETLITGLSGGVVQQPLGGVRIVDHGASREVFVGALHTGGWRDKLTALVHRCI